MASDDFYLVLPSNSSMSMYPNNTLAHYVTNLPRRIILSGEWECGLTEIHYPHDWYNVIGARLTVEHDGKMDTDAYFTDGYYGSAKVLVSALNDGARVWQFVRGLLRTVAPLIKRGALALGNRALKTGTQIAGDVLSGQNIRTAAKRRVKIAGNELLQSLLVTPPGKRVKRAAPKKRTKRRTRTTTKIRLPQTDVFS